MIDEETGNRLKQQMVDAETGDVVEGDQKGRGYELSKGKYVEVEKDELEAVQIESNHTIDIDSFVPRDEIDKRYLDHPYYIVPDGKAAVDAFAVIRDAMKDEDRVALARIVLTNRRSTSWRSSRSARACSAPRCDILTSCATRTTISMTSRPRRSPRTWSNSRATSCRPRPRAFRILEAQGRIREHLKALVRRKASGKPIKAAEHEEKPDNVVNLMDALKASLKGKSAAKRRAHAPASRRAPARRTAKKAHRSTARQRKAG